MTKDQKESDDGVKLFSDLGKAKGERAKLDGALKGAKADFDELEKARIAEEKDDADAALNDITLRKDSVKQKLDVASTNIVKYDQEKKDLEQELKEL